MGASSEKNIKSQDNIKEGDLVYIIHNDTQKYLHINLAASSTLSTL